jgi:hypothetical protein
MYSKITTVTGLTRDRAELDTMAVASVERGDWLTANALNAPYRNGFWKIDTIVKHAKRHGAVGVITVKHQYKYGNNGVWKVLAMMKIDVATSAVVA